MTLLLPLIGQGGHGHEIGEPPAEPPVDERRAAFLTALGAAYDAALARGESPTFMVAVLGQLDGPGSVHIHEHDMPQAYQTTVLAYAAWALHHAS